jgi:hypothetical protein
LSIDNFIKILFGQPSIHWPLFLGKFMLNCRWIFCGSTFIISLKSSSSYSLITLFVWKFYMVPAPKHHATKADSCVKLHVLTSILGGEWSVSRSGRLTPSAYWMGASASHRFCLDTVNLGRPAHTRESLFSWSYIY